jgi:hypothetical protein
MKAAICTRYGPPDVLRIRDLVFLTDLVEAGALVPVIDRRYELDQIAEAHRYVDLGRKKGNVIVSVIKQVDQHV